MQFQKHPTDPRFIDLTGQIFDRLTVRGYAGKQGRRHLWYCQCTCGNITCSQSGNLKTGHTTSCGCKGKEHISKLHVTHGLSKHPLYHHWASMKRRCENPRSRHYSRYGGRGIQICDRWQSPQNFFDDMGNPPFPKMEIDRIDNDGDYSPENCQWATRLEQTNNTSRNVMITINNRTQSRSMWARELGIKYHTVRTRVHKYGWSEIDALLTPLHSRPLKQSI